jgi:hypothetical protein
MRPKNQQFHGRPLGVGAATRLNPAGGPCVSRLATVSYVLWDYSF